MTPRSDPKTILLVDDDPLVLKYVATMLISHGYDVMTGISGEDAIEKAEHHPGEIALLLSDFQMPGMSGVDLAVKLTAKRPQIKVLLMSGYTGGMLVLNEGWHFLAKPFVESQLNALIIGLLYPGNPSRFTR